MLWAARAGAQDARPLPVIDVPYISQSEDLCGGAAAAMVLRYWGERGLTAESFRPLLDRSASGIRTDTLMAFLQQRGWNATGVRGSDALLAGELAAGRPVLTLIQDRPGTYHYIVVVALAERGVVFHDPARAPFRVMQRQEFARRWRVARNWMAVVTPANAEGAGGARGAADDAQGSLVDGREAARTAPDPIVDAQAGGADGQGSTSRQAAIGCEALVAEGVARARANDLDAAEQALTRGLSCPGGAASRELAGVRLLQRRWADVSELSASAVAADPLDAYAWRLLGTSLFVQDEAEAALLAWNHVAEPTVDLVRVDGLVRTRQPIVEHALGVRLGDLLTIGVLTRARRQLVDLPAAFSAHLEYVPAGSGRVEVRAAIVERPIRPSRWTIPILAISAATVREVVYTIGSLTGGGEALTLDWRFWPRRPHFGIGLQAPAAWGGNWGVDAFVDRQPFDIAALPRAERTAARLTASRWVSGAVRVDVRGGVDRWAGGPRTAYAALGGRVRYASRRDRLVASFDTDTWSGPQAFQTASALVRARSSAQRRGLVFTARGGADRASTSARLDLWPAGDTGNARNVTLRAHPVIRDGRLEVARLGRAVLHASGEAQHWWSGPLASRVAAAAFADSARTLDRRGGAAPITDVDLGVGARFSIAFLPGTVRIDVAHGLRDGANALSFVFGPF